MVLLEEKDLIGTAVRIRLTGRRHEHIRKVLKAKTGDELCVGLLGGKIGTGEILSIDDKDVEIDATLTKDPPEPLPLTLVLALPRPVVFKRLLAQITTLGVKKIYLLHTARVEKSYWKSPALGEKAVREQFMLGLEQAKDTILPELKICGSFKKFILDELPGIAKRSRVFVADPGSGAAAPACPGEMSTLVIGPEGGFIPTEIESLARAGCAAINFGKRILRVETAVIASIARLANF